MQTYKDGVCAVYCTKNIAQPGKKAEYKLEPKVPLLRYDERTVGIKRFYTAMQADTRIDRLIRCPRLDSVSVHDVVMIGGEQYDAEQVQYPTEVKPPSMDITLRRLEGRYESV